VCTVGCGGGFVLIGREFVRAGGLIFGAHTICYKKYITYHMLKEMRGVILHGKFYLHVVL